MRGPHHCLGRDPFASGPEIRRRLLQLRQNASILEQGCAGFSPGSANRCDHFTRHPGRTSSPLRAGLGFRYTQAARLTVQDLGYSGLSFRELAKDVGIKSASIHYYFATKGELGAALASRYTAHYT